MSLPGVDTRGVDTREQPMVCKEWVAVLELSCMWQIAKVRGMAIQKILEFPVGANGQLDLLRLSTRLGVTEIRDAAIQALSVQGILKPIEMIHLGTELQVHSWLLQGYKDLVEAQGEISVEDEMRLGWETTSKLFRIRDEYLQKRPRARANKIVTTRIKEVFGKSLEEAGWDGKSEPSISNKTSGHFGSSAPFY
jgi:hypothetical protein